MTDGGRARTITASVSLVLVGLGVTSACSSGAPISSPTTERATTTVAASPLPPRDTGALVKVVEPLLPSDDEIQRVYLQVGANAGDVLLSIYVRPVRARTADEYARRIAPLARRVMPVLFDRYPGVVAIDLCQEAVNHAADDASPPPVTRVFVLRSDLADIDWTRLDLQRLLAQARGRRAVFQFEVNDAVAASPTYREAQPS